MSCDWDCLHGLKLCVCAEVLCWLPARLPSTLQDQDAVFLISKNLSQKVTGADFCIFTGEEPSLNFQGSEQLEGVWCIYRMSPSLLDNEDNE